MSLPLFLAVLGDLPKTNRSFGKLTELIFSDVLVIIGVGLGLLVLLAAAVYIGMRLRRRRKRVSSGEKVYRDAEDTGELDSPEVEEDEEEDDDAEGEGHSGHHGDGHHGKRRYKYRVRRRTHRSRNPTLSETGGLPPVRTEEPSKPC
jgi:hypothetical protein